MKKKKILLCATLALSALAIRPGQTHAMGAAPPKPEQYQNTVDVPQADLQEIQAALNSSNTGQANQVDYLTEYHTDLNGNKVTTPAGCRLDSSVEHNLLPSGQPDPVAVFSANAWILNRTEAVPNDPLRDMDVIGCAIGHKAVSYQKSVDENGKVTIHVVFADQNCFKNSPPVTGISCLDPMLNNVTIVYTRGGKVLSLSCTQSSNVQGETSVIQDEVRCVRKSAE